jgi:hypothetical protein
MLGVTVSDARRMLRGAAGATGVDGAALSGDAASPLRHPCNTPKPHASTPSARRWRRENPLRS